MRVCGMATLCCSPPTAGNRVPHPLFSRRARGCMGEMQPVDGGQRRHGWAAPHTTPGATHPRTRGSMPTARRAASTRRLGPRHAGGRGRRHQGKGGSWWGACGWRRRRRRSRRWRWRQELLAPAAAALTVAAAGSSSAAAAPAAGRGGAGEDAEQPLRVDHALPPGACVSPPPLGRCRGEDEDNAKRRAASTRPKLQDPLRRQR